MTTAAPATTTAGDAELEPRRWLILGVLVVSLLAVVLDHTVLNVALPTIQRELDATQEELIWAINAYTCVFGAMLFAWGVLGDRIGRKRVLLIGLVLFGTSSIMAAQSSNALQLIISRGFMGLAGASVMPVTLALIMMIFPPHERGKAIGMWAGAVGSAMALGPLVGGWLLEHFWWGSIFLLNVPVVVIGVIAIWIMVPESKSPDAKRLDVFGVALTVAGLLAVTYGILHGGDIKDWLAPSVLGPIVIGSALLAYFVWREWRSNSPSLDFSLFKIRSFSASLTGLSLGFAALAGTMLFLTYYWQVVRGFSPLEAGLTVLPIALGQILAAPLSGRMVGIFGARKVMLTGLGILVCVYTAMSFVTTTAPVWLVMVIFFFLGYGLGNVTAPATTRMSLAVPLARSGAGSAVQNTVRQVAAALGVAVISSIVAVAYNKQIEPALTGVPEQFQAAAQDSVIQTHAVAQALESSGRVELLEQAGQIPAGFVDHLIQAADNAFIDAFHIATAVSAVLAALAFAVIAWRLPREPELAADQRSLVAAQQE